MNGNPKAASTQESIAFHFDFADATDPAERERLLMGELRRTQSALAEADIEIKQKQRALAERAFEQEAADARVFCTPPAGPLISMSGAIPQDFGSPTSAAASSATKPGKVCPATAGARIGSLPRRPCQNQQRIPHHRNGGRSLRRQLLRAAQGRQAHVGPRRREVPAR